jgi:hypothetical protein
MNGLRLLQMMVVVLSLTLAQAALAQSATATLTGSVTDERGAVIAGAKVTLTDIARAVQREVTTNNDGLFVVPQLAPSRYKIKVEQSGFATAEIAEVVLNVGEQSSVRIQLKVAQFGEVVTISGVSVIGDSATPVNVLSGRDPFGLGFTTVSQPDLVAGQPLYLENSSFAGGKRFNPAAFDGATPLAQGRQGTLGRNVLRGFGASPLDIALRRQFDLTERLHLQFRADAFNLFNQANFANPNGILTSAIFGRATQMLSNGLGGLSPLFQIGGPRSIQLALKLQF